VVDVCTRTKDGYSLDIISKGVEAECGCGVNVYGLIICFMCYRVSIEKRVSSTADNVGED
jgi:hypothetical protein